MASSICIPTVTFEVPKVQLPFGIELQATADFSKGPPTQCALLASLLLQLAPAMAAMTPLLTVLNVFADLKSFLQGDVTKLVALLGDLTAVIEMLSPLQFLESIKSILLLVIAYLNCFIESLTSLLEFQASIDLSLAVGNPDLQASLQCANGNAGIAIQQMMLSLGPLGPVSCNCFSPLSALQEFPLRLPAISSLQGEKDIEGALKSLSKMLTDLQKVLEAL